MGIRDIWLDPAVPVILRSSVTSPFGRKLRMAAIELGLADRITREHADTLDAQDTLRLQNPLGKLPCLLIGDHVFYDSWVILDLFDDLAGRDRLFPAKGMARYHVLTRAKLADGITDAALLMVYEGRFRDSLSPRWLDHQTGKIHRALADFEAQPPAISADIVGITLACALGYLDWRAPVAWREDHPTLVTWFEHFAQVVPSFSQTERTNA